MAVHKPIVIQHLSAYTSVCLFRDAIAYGLKTEQQHIIFLALMNETGNVNVNHPPKKGQITCNVKMITMYKKAMTTINFNNLVETCRRQKHAQVPFKMRAAKTLTAHYKNT